MNKIRIKIVFFYFFCAIIYAQKNKDSLKLNLNFTWKSEPLELNKNYISKSDTLQLSLLKFYVSGIEIVYEDGFVTKEKNSYHLVDFEDDITKSISIINRNEIPISEINFNIGVDSIASVSGALSGDLDLQKGMYWAWQSGYINIKIEGKSNSCKTRKNAFQFHIGGYLKPNYALRKISIKNNKSNNNQINLVMDLSNFFETINLSQSNSIMIPGEKANVLADKIQQTFSIE